MITDNDHPGRRLGLRFIQQAQKQTAERQEPDNPVLLARELGDELVERIKKSKPEAKEEA